MLGPRLVIVERFGDRAKSQPHGYAMYHIAGQRGGAFKIDPAHMLFTLQERGFYTPPDWRLQLE